MNEENTAKSRLSDLIKRKIPVAGDASSAAGAIPKTYEAQADTDNGAAMKTLGGNADAHWPTSIIGAFVGMLIGTLPASIWALIFGFSFSPLYLLVPLCVYYGIRILNGHEGTRGFILTVIFSLLGLYLTVLSCLATVDVLKFKMFVFNLPLITIAMIGKSDVLTSPAFSSANVFPVVFTVIGAALAYELLMRRAVPSGDSASDTENAQTDVL